MTDNKNTVCVIIPIYGDIRFWQPLANRAAQSVVNQTVKAEVLTFSTGANIADARNKFGLQPHGCEYVIFLDADDELHPSYIEEMLKGNGDIRVPTVHKHYSNGRVLKGAYEPKDLITGNYIVVGAMIKAELFNKLEGFHNYESLEDWDLWLRAEEAGATFEQIPGAIYKVNKRPGSRNSNAAFDEVLNNAKERRGIE